MDALFVITLSRAAEERVISHWHECGVQELPVQEDNQGLLTHPPAYFADFVRAHANK